MAKPSATSFLKKSSRFRTEALKGFKKKVFDHFRTLTERGIVWGLSENPTIADNLVPDISIGTGTFDVTVSGLDNTKTYYSRTHAINEYGVFYGYNITFTVS